MPLVLLAVAVGACGEEAREEAATASAKEDRLAGPELGTFVDVRWAAEGPPRWIGVTEDGRLRASGDSPGLVDPPAGERFRRSLPDGVTITRRGRLYRVARERTVSDLGIRVQAGSSIASGARGTWIAGEAGGLAVLEGTEVVTHWETGDGPTSALATGRAGMVVVGRASGEVEAGEERDPKARRVVFRFDGPVATVAVGPDGSIAAADVRGTVRVERAESRTTTEWAAGGMVVGLGFSKAGAGPVAVREDGAVVAPPGAGGSPAVVLRLGTRVRAADATGTEEGTAFVVATDDGVRTVRATLARR